jgi:hypothetical protein
MGGEPTTANNKGLTVEEQEAEHANTVKSPTFTTNPTRMQLSETTKCSTEGDEMYTPVVPPITSFNQMKHSIIIPPSSAAPEFHGKHSERPTRFLRESALEWYCQLRMSHSRPHTWREQKPKETENDLVKHLFCRMRNDLLNMIGISRNASLKDVIMEVQQIEEIIYRRAKGQRQINQLKPTSLQNTTSPTTKHYNDETRNQRTTSNR